MTGVWLDMIPQGLLEQNKEHIEKVWTERTSQFGGRPKSESCPLHTLKFANYCFTTGTNRLTFCFTTNMIYSLTIHTNIHVVYCFTTQTNTHIHCFTTYNDHTYSIRIILIQYTLPLTQFFTTYTITLYIASLTLT